MPHILYIVYITRLIGSIWTFTFSQHLKKNCEVILVATVNDRSDHLGRLTVFQIIENSPRSCSQSITQLGLSIALRLPIIAIKRVTDSPQYGLCYRSFHSATADATSGAVEFRLTNLVLLSTPFTIVFIWWQLSFESTDYNWVL